MLPILDQVMHWKTGAIREVFESYGLTLNEWEKERTDRVNIVETRVFDSRAKAGAL